jgi:hypothetical protein
VPGGWGNLLSQQAFKKLRLNLAHFGSFWCHDVGTKPVVLPGEDGYSNDARCAFAPLNSRQAYVCPRFNFLGLSLDTMARVRRTERKEPGVRPPMVPQSRSMALAITVATISCRLDPKAKKGW